MGGRRRTVFVPTDRHSGSGDGARGRCGSLVRACRRSRGQFPRWCPARSQRIMKDVDNHARGGRPGHKVPKRGSAEPHSKAGRRGYDAFQQDILFRGPPLLGKCFRQTMCSVLPEHVQTVAGGAGDARFRPGRVHIKNQTLPALRGKPLPRPRSAFRCRQNQQGRRQGHSKQRFTGYSAKGPEDAGGGESFHYAMFLQKIFHSWFAQSCNHGGVHQHATLQRGANAFHKRIPNKRTLRTTLQKVRLEHFRRLCRPGLAVPADRIFCEMTPAGHRHTCPTASGKPPLLFFQFFYERCALDAQQLRRLVFHAFGPVQCLVQKPFFSGVQKFLESHAETF